MDMDMEDQVMVMVVTDSEDKDMVVMVLAIKAMDLVDQVMGIVISQVSILVTGMDKDMEEGTRLTVMHTDINMLITIPMDSENAEKIRAALIRGIIAMVSIKIITMEHTVI